MIVLVRSVVVLLGAASLVLASGCMRYGYLDGSIGRSRYGVVSPGYVAATTTTTSTTVYVSPHAVGPTTITYGSYPAYGAYGYGTTYSTGGTVYSSDGASGVYSGYDTSGYGYGVTSAYGAPAGYGAAPTTGATVVVRPR